MFRKDKYLDVCKQDRTFYYGERFSHHSNQSYF